jgi:hypothetical protein
MTCYKDAPRITVSHPRRQVKFYFSHPHKNRSLFHILLSKHEQQVMNIPQMVPNFLSNIFEMSLKSPNFFFFLLLLLKIYNKQTNSAAVSSQANYNDRASADGRRSQRQLLPVMVIATGPHGGQFGSLDRSRYFLIQTAPQLPSRS